MINENSHRPNAHCMHESPPNHFIGTQRGVNVPFCEGMNASFDKWTRPPPSPGERLKLSRTPPITQLEPEPKSTRQPTTPKKGHDLASRNWLGQNKQYAWKSENKQKSPSGNLSSKPSDHNGAPRADSSSKPSPKKTNGK